GQHRQPVDHSAVDEGVAQHAWRPALYGRGVTHVRYSSGPRRRLLLRRLHRPLLLTDLEHAFVGVDVGDRRPVRGNLFPPGRSYAETLAEQTDEDPRLVPAEAREREHTVQQVVTGRRIVPDVRRVPVVVLHQVHAERVR